MSKDLVQDVQDFFDKFDLPSRRKPKILDEDTLTFRTKFMVEELQEFRDACANDDLVGAIDGLCDLVYVALGTAIMMGAPFNACWDEVQRANMSKVRAINADDPRSTRKHRFDIVKPTGWKAPDLQKVIDEQI